MTTQGKSIRIKVSGIREVGRIAQGVKLMNLAAGDAVRSIARIVQGTDDGEFDEDEEAQVSAEEQTE